MQRAQRKHWTRDDLARLPEDGKRYEVIEGELVMMTGPSIDHQFTLAEIYVLVRAWAAAGPGGPVVFAPLDVELAYDIVVQPDLIWIRPDRVAEIVDHHVRGIPDLVVEVLSPSSARHDRIRKAAIYARFGADEYWLADPDTRVLEIHRLERRRFVLHARGSGRDALTSSLDPGLQVIPERLFRVRPS